MKNKTAANALRIAHLASAITVGICISGMDVAPMRILVTSGIAFAILLISYERLYYNRETRTWKPYSDTPIDDQVRRDLGIKD